MPHTYRNLTGERGAYLAVLSPPQGMQDFLLEAAAARPRRRKLGVLRGMEILDVVPEPSKAGS